MNATDGAPVRGFRHEALMYSGTDDFAARAVPIIVRALEAGEAALVAVDQAKIGLLRDHLGSAAGSVAWKDIRAIGGNPARIIPVWHQFVARHGGRGRIWGFGEPIWAGRTEAELVEAQRHEQLLNLAFAGASGFTLICPYDTGALNAAVIHEAHHSHPTVIEGEPRESATYPGLATLAGPFHASLDDPPGEAPQLLLDGVVAAGIRSFLADHTSGAQPATARIDDLTVAVAAVTGSMGRPGARLRVWQDGDAVLAELRDLTPVEDPLAGREWPPPSEAMTRGLWLANQLCDLVQLRSHTTDAVVRLRVGR
jgi:hypothetical protein